MGSSGQMMLIPIISEESEVLRDKKLFESYRQQGKYLSSEI